MNQQIVRWASQHKRALLFLVFVLAIIGMGISSKVPVSLFPHVDFPRIVISLDVGDTPANQMVLDVTRPIEQAVRAVPGVSNIKSTTSRGSAEVSVSFNWQQNMVQALLQIQGAVQQVLSQLPASTQYDIRRMDPTIFPILALSLTSKTDSMVTLKDTAEFEIVPRLTAIEGVAKATVSGGDDAEYRVEVDPEKLIAMSLTLDDITQKIATDSTLQAVGKLEQQFKLYLLVNDAQFRTLDDIKAVPIAQTDAGVVRLADIASVYLTTKPQWQRVSANGSDAVLVQVYQQPTGDTTRIASEVRSIIGRYQSSVSDAVAIQTWYDQSELVTQSAMSVAEAMIIGVVLAALVLFAFLRNAKTMLIGVCVVPMSLTITILLLHVLGMSFNIMTLGGMAAAIGLIIDDAIVVIEHIVSNLKTESDSLHQRIISAASHISKPLAGSSAATIVIFCPLALLDGVTGAFFKALSLTMASSLIISFFIALFCIPLIATSLFSSNDAQKEVTRHSNDQLLRLYERIFHRVTTSPAIVFITLVAVIVVSTLAYRQVGTGFMPTMDEGGFVLDYRAKPGTSLAETDRLLRQVESLIVETPEVTSYSRRTGLQLGGGLSEANEGDFFIQLKALPRKPIDEVMNELRQKIIQNVPGLDIEMVLLMEDVIGDLTSVPQPIEIKLFSDNVDELLITAPKVADEIARVDGVVDINSGVNIAGDSFQFVVNKTLAQTYGVTPAWITAQLSQWFSGVVSTQVHESQKNIGIRVWVPEQARDLAQAVNAIWLTKPDGNKVPLKHLVSIKKVVGEPQINRENLKRTVSVTARIEGRDLGSTMTDIKKVLEQGHVLPSSTYYQLGGLYQQQQTAFKSLTYVFIAALAILFALILYLYEDMLIASSILISSLMAAGIVFVGLWATGTDLNITAIMGMTMILGIVTEVAIFYFSEFSELRSTQTDTYQALLQAGKNRLRPILMTTLAAILALAPLAFAFGQGAEMQQPLAIAIISGLLVQLPLVTLFAPAWLLIMKRTKTFLFKNKK